MIHPNYNPVSALNDAAVIILEEQLVVNSALPEPVALNTVAARPHPNASVVVTGFGDTFDGSEEGSQQLMHVRLRYYTPRICKALIAEYLATTSDPTPIDNPAVMCAGLPYKDSCQGDSGGPLLLNSGAKKFLQVGIVSNGPACGDPRNPAGIYTRVSAPIIKSFIQAQITANKPVMHGFVALRIQGKLVNCADTICTLNARAGSTIYAMTYFATNKPVKLVLCGMFDTCLTITDGQLGKIPCLLAPEFSVTTATKGRLQLKLDGQCVRSDKKRLVLGNCGGIQSLVTTVPKKKCA